MHKTVIEKLKTTTARQRLLTGTLVVILTVIVAMDLAQPKHSVEAYCKVYVQEQSRLSKLPSGTYPSSVFNKDLNDPSQFVTSFGHLEKVAPTEIQPEVKTLKDVYATIRNKPSQGFQASLSGISAEDTVRQWTLTKCATTVNSTGNTVTKLIE